MLKINTDSVISRLIADFWLNRFCDRKLFIITSQLIKIYVLYIRNLQHTIIHQCPNSTRSSRALATIFLKRGRKHLLDTTLNSFFSHPILITSGFVSFSLLFNQAKTTELVELNMLSGSNINLLLF